MICEGFFLFLFIFYLLFGLAMYEMLCSRAFFSFLPSFFWCIQVLGFLAVGFITRKPSTRQRGTEPVRD